MSPRDSVEFHVEQGSDAVFTFGGPIREAWSVKIDVQAARVNVGKARDALRLAAYDLVARLDALDKAEERLK